MHESTYRTLIAWQEAMKLAVEVYEFSKAFPSDERFSLTQQIRRSAISVASNIAEGRGRGSDADYRRFLYQARGSLYEIETHAALSELIGYTSTSDVAAVMKAIGEAIRPLNGLIAKLDRKLGN